ncbi:uncharacterized protein [Narcine bancroftii]|uniref:uncharacterized protein isoform X2 n=1 Tax=Narcine bancroftii TaxID=1343680 RepID=UPI003831F946
MSYLQVPVTGHSFTNDGAEEDSNPLQTYLIVGLVLLVLILVVGLAAIIGVALVYFKLNQIQKMISEKDDETYAQIGANIIHFTQGKKDQDLASSNGNMKGNNGIVENSNECDNEKRSNKCPFLKIPDGIVQPISMEIPNEVKLNTESTKYSSGVRGNVQLSENIPKYFSPPSYNRELNYSQRNFLQQTKELQTFGYAANDVSNQKPSKKTKTQPAANIPEPPSPDSSSYAIYDVPRPCFCSSMCHALSPPTPASDFQHNPLKRSLSEIGPSAFEIPLEMVQDNKYAVPRPVTFPGHENYEAEFKDLEKSSSKDSGVLSCVDSQLLDLIPEGNEPHLDSKNNLENKQRQVVDKESIEDKSEFF